MITWLLMGEKYLGRNCFRDILQLCMAEVLNMSTAAQYDWNLQIYHQQDPERYEAYSQHLWMDDVRFGKWFGEAVLPRPPFAEVLAIASLLNLGYQKLPKTTLFMWG